jgi:hypothetical protein
VTDLIEFCVRGSGEIVFIVDIRFSLGNNSESLSFDFLMIFKFICSPDASNRTILSSS